MEIGVDIEEVRRFNKWVANEKYLCKIFSKEEIRYSTDRRMAAQHLAVRFAAKEAVWKMLNSKTSELLIADIAIVNEENGKPQVYIKNKKQSNIKISLSHTKKYAVAVAISDGDICV
ncbi:MAG: holo-ACP synthase [Elusimicrobiota bacterium]|jgi:holo-[acyl-carrier protein] synthase|nr:holo-ACP synthase [Elusimicrobiota bacterium]